MKNLQDKLVFNLKATGILSLFTLFLGIQTGTAQYTELYTMSGSNNGNAPYGYLTLSGSTLYGMTSSGGTGFGNIFSVDTTGTGYSNLYNFSSGANGSVPYGSLVISGNVLYGETYSGGTSNIGNIFSIHTDGTGYTDLHDFSNTDGANPVGALTLSGSVLYGATEGGGAHGDGVVFSIDTNGTGYSDLHDFNGTDGLQPSGLLTLSAGVLYGVTSLGGINGDGNIFSITTSGSGFTDMLDFAGANGKDPNSGFDLVGAVLYGVTAEGGLNDSGCVFSINTNGTGYADLHDFTLKSGYEPDQLTLVNIGSILYGMTENGGTGGYGVIFSINTNGSSYTDMINFSAFNSPDPGSFPLSSLTRSGANLYGMTSEGGSGFFGVVFKLIPVGSAGVSSLTLTNNEIVIYPNPNNGKFTVTFSSQEKQVYSSTIEVYNELGQQVLVSTINNIKGNTSIDMGSQPNGIYLYKIIDQNGSPLGQGKLVVQK